MRDAMFAEVVYALPGEQRTFRVRIDAATTVRSAIETSGVLDHHAELRTRPWSVGIFGERVDLDAIVAPGDRIEIYRPLVADPKDSRRRRAARRAEGR